MHCILIYGLKGTVIKQEGEELFKHLLESDFYSLLSHLQLFFLFKSLFSFFEFSWYRWLPFVELSIFLLPFKAAIIYASSFFSFDSFGQEQLQNIFKSLRKRLTLEITCYLHSLQIKCLFIQLSSQELTLKHV